MTQTRTQTYSLAILDVLPSTFADIRRRLLAAGYEDTINDLVGQINMNGLAIEARPEPPERNALDVYQKARDGLYVTTLGPDDPRYSAEIERVTAAFKRDALLHVGLHDHPKCDEIYAFAVRSDENAEPLLILWALDRIAGFMR